MSSPIHIHNLIGLPNTPAPPAVALGACECWGRRSAISQEAAAAKDLAPRWNPWKNEAAFSKRWWLEEPKFGLNTIKSWI